VRPGNRYMRRTLGALVTDGAVLVVVCRVCNNRRMLYPIDLINDYGETCYVVDLRPRLRCSKCRRFAALIHEATR
jgi:hypothetical protein